jgi:DNA-binding transcriptional MerR regulator
LDKSPDAFRTISEAAEELDLPQHVLRFWETRFSTIRPLKRGGGRRYYRPEDVLLLKGIRHLLYDQGFTIKGVQKILKDQGARHVATIGDGGGADAPQQAGLDAAEGGESAVEVAPRMNGYAVNRDDRERLTTVLKELLEMKRLLDRARE